MNKRYTIKVRGEKVEVSKEIYEAYYGERDAWRKQRKRDKYHRLISYDSLDAEEHSGESLIVDERASVEEMVMARLEAEQLRRCIKLLNDKYNILYLISIGYTETEIAKMCGVAQVTVHKMKKRLFKNLRDMLE